MVPAGAQSSARGKTALLALMFAGGLGYGASRCGVVALGAHDDHPTEMSALTAGEEPINRWVSVRGRVAPGSFFKSSQLMAFRLLDGGSLILITDTQQHPTLSEGSEEAFTGVLSQPGLGSDQSDEVSLHGQTMKMKGIFGGYCNKVGGCIDPIKVMLVGEEPKSRIWAWFGMIALSAIALLLAGVALKPRRKNVG